LLAKVNARGFNGTISKRFPEPKVYVSSGGVCAVAVEKCAQQPTIAFVVLPSWGCLGADSRMWAWTFRGSTADCNPNTQHQVGFVLIVELKRIPCAQDISEKSNKSAAPDFEARSEPLGSKLQPLQLEEKLRPFCRARICDTCAPRRGKLEG